MSQQEIYQIIKKHPRLTAKEIIQKADISDGNVRRAIRCLIKHGFIMDDFMNEEEYERRLEKDPKVKHGRYSIKVFEIIENE